MILGLLIYFSSLFSPFIHDDVFFIKENPDIANFDFQPMFSATRFNENNIALINNYYRPVVEIYNRLIFKGFGLNPAYFHFVNILFHILNTFLFFLVFKLFLDRKVSFILALIFLIHPVQSEAVCAISGISNLLFATFILISMYLYVLSEYFDKNIDSNLRRNFLNYCFYSGSLIMFFLSIFTKEQAFVFPFVLIALKIFGFIPSFDFKENKKLFVVGIIKIAGYFVLSFSCLIFRFSFYGLDLSANSAFNGETLLRLLSIPKTLLVFLQIVFFPFGLHYFRTINVLGPKLIYFLFLIGIIILGFYLFNKVKNERKNLYLFGFIWFFIWSIPTLNIFPLIVEYSHILVAEHFVYISCFGLFLSSFAVMDSFRSIELFGFKKIFIILLIVLSIITLKQTFCWRNEVTLFENSIKYETDIARIRILLANALSDQNEDIKSIKQNIIALKITDGYLRIVSDKQAAMFYLKTKKDILINLADSYDKLRNFRQAVMHYMLAFKLDSFDANLINKLGISFVKINDFDNAQKYFKLAIKVNKYNMHAYNNLAISLIGQNKLIEARDILTKALSIDQNSQTTKINLNKLINQLKNNGVNLQ